MKNNTNSVYENIKYIICNWLKWDNKGTIIAFMKIPIEILIPIIISFMNKALIELILNKANIIIFIWVLGAVSLLLGVLNCISHMISENISAFQQNISIHYAVEAFEKLLTMDYELLESYEGRMKFERCRQFAFDGNQSDGAWAAVRLIGLIESILGIFTYTILFSYVSPILILFILVTCLLESFTYHAANKIAIKTENEMVHDEMYFSYFFRLATDFVAEKDIRLNSAAGWLEHTLNKSIAVYTKVMRWYTNETTKLTVLQALCSMIRDTAIFSFLIWDVWTGNIAVSDFVFCFGLVGGFSSWLNGISGHLASLHRISSECFKYREFMSLKKSVGISRNLLSDNDINSIEFCDVSFTYDNKKLVLDHINLKVQKGERISIVGENGAGKTTFIKLLCGLYNPTSGKILVNGHDLKYIEKSTYFKQLAAVFQDYTLLPSNILKNITLAENYDKDKVWKVLEDVELSEKIKKLRNGLETKLGRQLDKDASSLSGGEMQKLLFARALYKDAPILILDEPTAALDPIAEEMLYLQYQDLTKDKISFFTSHRLTSTRFCDKIIFMKNGKITECGSHFELMSKGGEYSNMYKLQGFYYQQEVSHSL